MSDQSSSEEVKTENIEKISDKDNNHPHHRLQQYHQPQPDPMTSNSLPNESLNQTKNDDNSLIINASNNEQSCETMKKSSSSTTSPITTTVSSPMKGKSPIKTTTFGVEVITSSKKNDIVHDSVTSLTQPGPSGIGYGPVESSSLSDSSSAAGFKTTNYHYIQSPSRMTVYDNGGTHLEIQTLHNSSDKRYQCLPGTLPTGIVHDTAGSVESDHSIEYLDTLLPSNNAFPVDDPIIIRGNGNMTLFGLSNSFTNTFPSALLGRVSREEFEHTMSCINHLLQQQHSTNAKFLLLGCLCCCCSLGCSLLWPTVALSKRTRNSLDKLLAMENSRLYNKLGLNWNISKQQCHTNHSFMEYILIIEFLPKLQIYQPD